MTIAIRQLGVVDYVTTYEAMRLFTKERTASTLDEIWVLEHPPFLPWGSQVILPTCTLRMAPFPWFKLIAAVRLPIMALVSSSSIYC
jgi:lipoate-protein ligase B